MIKSQRVRVDDASDNSSLCANSDLSNISDESLPSDMEEVEVRVQDSTSGIFLLLTCILGLCVGLFYLQIYWNEIFGSDVLTVG